MQVEMTIEQLERQIDALERMMTIQRKRISARQTDTHSLPSSSASERAMLDYLELIHLADSEYLTVELEQFESQLEQLRTIRRSVGGSIIVPQLRTK